jgi:hypothetical protein
MRRYLCNSGRGVGEEARFDEHEESSDGIFHMFRQTKTFVTIDIFAPQGAILSPMFSDYVQLLLQILNRMMDS